MQPQIHSTEYPTEPPQGFEQWYKYILAQQGEKEPLQRFKEQTEQSFEVLHNSITHGNLKRQ